MEISNCFKTSRRRMWFIYIVSTIFLISVYSLAILEPMEVQLNKCMVPASNKYVRAVLDKFNFRGRNYFIHREQLRPQDTLHECVFTYWSLSHSMMHMLVGFVAPDLFWENFFYGVMFEIIEYYLRDCHDAMDIIANTSGYLLGRYLNHLAFRGTW